MAAIPKVFISYSHDDDHHKEWVHSLATRLCSDGVDVTLDQWHAVPGDRLPHFMETAIRESDFVLIICTPNYCRKANSRQGGVGYEGDIITGEVFNRQDNKQKERKFVPILRSGDADSAIATWLAGKLYIDLCRPHNYESQYRELLKTLHGARPAPPPLGPRPFFSSAALVTSILSDLKVPSFGLERGVLVAGVILSIISISYLWTYQGRTTAAPIKKRLDNNATPLSAEQERRLKPGDTFKECAQCPQMTVVPSGSFEMGSPESEPGRATNESPQQRVTLKNPFSVGRFSVTFDEWDACGAEGGCNGYRPADRGWGRATHPAIGISWSDAKAYVAWLSKKTGKEYRLPTEAEREYFTRAGTTSPFWWGTSITPEQANYNGTSAYNEGAKGQYRGKTVPVETFTPNPWGLYQVHGNVQEWTEDCYQAGRLDVPADGSARRGIECTFRVLRGGSWRGAPTYVRSASRYGGVADRRNPTSGFRVVRALTH